MYGVIIQISATTYSSEVFEILEYPIHFFILTHGVPWIGLILSSCLFVANSKNVYKKFIYFNKDIVNFIENSRLLFFISISTCLFVILVYLAFVPFKSTGFYHNFFLNDPLSAILARENSLKLLPFTWLKYLFTFYIRFLGLFAVSLAASRVVYYFNRRNISKTVFYIFISIILVIGAMLPGSKVGGVLILLSFSISFAIFSKLQIGLLKLTSGFLLIISPSIFTQMSKFNRQGWDGLLVVLDEIILRRIIYVPMKAGIDWLAYVEKFGYWGIAGIPKLSWLVGIEGVNVPNTIANYYWEGSYLTSGFMNVSFMFSFYSYFGVASYFLILICFVVLDSYVLIFKYIKSVMLVPFVIFCNISVINLLSSDFLTIFLTYGYFTGLLFVFFMQSLIYKK